MLKLFPKSKWYPKPKHHQLIHIFLAIHQVWVSRRTELLRKFSQRPSSVYNRLIEYMDIIIPIVINYGDVIRFKKIFLFSSRTLVHVVEKKKKRKKKNFF